MGERRYPQERTVTVVGVAGTLIATSGYVLSLGWRSIVVPGLELRFDSSFLLVLGGLMMVGALVVDHRLLRKSAASTARGQEEPSTAPALTEEDRRIRRSAGEILDDHLHLRKQGLVEEDIARNYAADVVLLTCTGIYRGHAGVRRSVEILRDHFPGTDFHYRNALVDGEMAFLEWTGHSAEGEIRDGADSYLIRNGLIAAQTIHYTVD